MKTAFVTGGGGGIGEAIAARLSRDGYRVAVVDMNLENAQAVAARVPNAWAARVDVTKEDSVRAALDAFGAVPDVLVNNAGIVHFQPFVEASLDDFRRVVDVNLMGTVIPTHIIAPGMMKRGSGVIINMSSMAAIAVGPTHGAYCATKAAVAVLAEQFALEFGPYGLRVNAIQPGLIDAGMGSTKLYVDQELVEARKKAVPSGRLGRGEDIANAVAFLVSDEAGYVNGTTLLVDGGVTKMLLSQLPRGRK